MIALGLLAQDSEFRRKILGKNHPGATVNLTAIQKDIIKQVQDNPNVTYNILADLLKRNRTTIYRPMRFKKIIHGNTQRQTTWTPNG